MSNLHSIITLTKSIPEQLNKITGTDYCRFSYEELQLQLNVNKVYWVPGINLDWNEHTRRLMIFQHIKVAKGRQ